MLSFISFWRAAAIVLSDLASSAYYVGGIAETAIGKSAPWFILGIMLFSYAVRAVYIESCSMFVRGGVYRVVREAMGATYAKFSVSALLFDYVLTGPISAVSAGLYLAFLLNESIDYFHLRYSHFRPEYFAAGFGVMVTLYFWRKNIIGIHESSEKALRIMQITTVMVVILIIWCIVTILKNGYQPVPFPAMSNIHLSPDAMGWLGKGFTSIPAVAILVGLGHSLLAMSGEESLAQVNREIAHPKLKNLERAGFVIFVYSLLFTSLVSFFAVMIIPDAPRQKYLDNLIGGLAMFLAGPIGLRLVFHAFVVLVGVLILSGAVNTSLIGANGVLNRVAEDGVLTDWFRKPQRKFGTTSRIVNMIAIMQLTTIIVSRGNIEMLGEAYAFGVAWSFAMNALSVTVLRYKMPHAREWKVPINFRIGGKEIPLGLVMITTMLFLLAGINVLTKKVATISGIVFTITFFLVFEFSERYNRKRHTLTAHVMGQENEQFRLHSTDEISAEALHIRPGNILVAVRNPHHLEHLHKTLEKTDIRRQDIVVVTVKVVTQAGSGEHGLEPDQVFADSENLVFSRVVGLAEKAGKHVELLTVPGTDPWLAVVQTAAVLKSARVVMGLSPNLTPAEQGRRVGVAWEELPQPRPSLSLEVVMPDPNQSMYFNLGPHPPRLWPEDVDLTHRLWLDLIDKGAGDELRHRDVVSVALQRLKRELQTVDSEEILRDVVATVQAHGPDKIALPDKSAAQSPAHH
jgi:amino acid transporter